MRWPAAFVAYLVLHELYICQRYETQHRSQRKTADSSCNTHSNNYDTSSNSAYSPSLLTCTYTVHAKQSYLTTVLPYPATFPYLTPTLLPYYPTTLPYPATQPPYHPTLPCFPTTLMPYYPTTTLPYPATLLSNYPTLLPYYPHTLLPHYLTTLPTLLPCYLQLLTFFACTYT